MVVHKRIAKAIKKRLPKAIKKRLPKKGKVEHDLPAFPSKYGIPPLGLGLLAARGNPVAVALLTYIAMEQTQPYWGPRVEAHGTRTRQQYDALMDEYFGSRGPRGSLPSLPDPRYLPEMPGVTSKAFIPPTRKTSKANKAMKKAYAWLIKGHKGKMTQKKCRELLKKASRMASKANPGTKSRIGKTSRSKMLKECKRIRKQVWGTLRRK